MKALNKIKSLFEKPSHPKQPYIYAVTRGDYLGELLVYAEKENDDYVFLVLPEMKIRRIPIAKFELGINNNIVDVVEKLPAYVHRTCMQQYNKNKFNVLALEDDKD
jgi:hypothetical protein